MRRRRVIVVVGACAVIAILGVALWPGEREPEYQGKKLSEWLEQYLCCVEAERDFWHGGLRHTKPGFDGLAKAQAEEAVRKIGTNALPWMVRRIAYEGSGLKLHTDWRAMRQWIRLKPIFSYSPRYTKKDRDADKAEWGFVILGTRASCVVPELVGIFESPSQAAGRAQQALAHVGKDALPYMLTILSTPEHPHRQGAAGCIAMMDGLGTNLIPAIPLLAHCLDDKDPFLASFAAYALGHAAVEPATVIPILVRALQTKDDYLKIAVVSALGDFCQAGRDAVPELQLALKSQNMSVRAGARVALKKIAPDVIATDDVSGRDGN